MAVAAVPASQQFPHVCGGRVSAKGKEMSAGQIAQTICRSTILLGSGSYL